MLNFESYFLRTSHSSGEGADKKDEKAIGVERLTPGDTDQHCCPTSVFGA